MLNKLDKRTVYAVLSASVASVVSVGALAAATTFVDTADHKESGFSNGQMTPFEAEAGVTTRGNYMRVDQIDGEPAVKSYWAQANYNGTRATRGAEAQPIGLQIHSDGWYAFRFYLPADFPTDKELAIAQIFSRGGCSSWSSMVVIRDNNLFLARRSSNGCTATIEHPLATNIQHGAWNTVILRFKASDQRAGELKAWCNNSNEQSPNINIQNLNFGAGAFVNGTLDPNVTNNWINLKFGQYDYDHANYTVGETRTIYFDDVSMLRGNPQGAFGMVKPQ
ncbi:heparin lyase I family protein [Asticcacaulis excentricus]|uniref:heparin lyase I family protein n=1 Tax=Asticcacaulis excentricus TaxID=78587 RepID=UPI000F825CB4|nr:heparin lyase I family protein [Asticcacaulis excentricus]